MTLPPDIAALLECAQPDFQALASFPADIGRDGRLTTEWLVVGVPGVALIRDGGVTLLAPAEIDSVATHPYLSGGRLTARRDGAVHLLARYSGARLAQAEAFARAANRALQAAAGRAAERAPQPDATPSPEPAEESTRANPGRVLPRLFAMMPAGKYWRVPVIALALAGSAAAAVLSPLLAGQFLFDEVLAPEGRFAGKLLLAVGLILLARVAEVGCNVTWGWTNAAFIHDLEITLKRTAFGSLQRLSMRQRISIARAILHDPRILILDEATSALDLETEERIHAALAALTAGRTVIAIAHRLATLRRAQRLVVMEAGRIAELGTHRQLLATGGRYRRMVEAQRALADAQTLTHA